MSSDIGANFLNALLGGLTQSVQSENDVVVEANFKVRLANPQRVAPVMQDLAEDNKQQESQPQPPNTGVTTAVTAGTRIPEAVVAQPQATVIPTTAPAPAAGLRVDAATRQAQTYTPVASETPALVPSTLTVASDYNPEYQNQFDRYLRTRQFDHMFGHALRGVGAPAPQTPGPSLTR